MRGRAAERSQPLLLLLLLQVAGPRRPQSRGWNQQRGVIALPHAAAAAAVTPAAADFSAAARTLWEATLGAATRPHGGRAAATVAPRRHDAISVIVARVGQELVIQRPRRPWIEVATAARAQPRQGYGGLRQRRRRRGSAVRESARRTHRPSAGASSRCLEQHARRERQGLLARGPRGRTIALAPQPRWALRLPRPSRTQQFPARG